MPTQRSARVTGAGVARTGRSLAQRFTTQRWLGLVLSVTAALTLIGSVCGALVLDRTAEVSNRLADRIQPARAISVELRAGWLEQQVAVRGYLISGDRQFLAPYDSGLPVQQGISQRLRRLLADEPELLRAVDRAEALSRQWRDEYADVAVAARAAAQPPEVALAQRGQLLSAQLAATLQELDTEIGQSQTRARADLTRARGWRDLTFAAILGVFVLTGVAVAILLRIAVLRPLHRLRVAARRVAAGDFDHRLVIDGPADLRELAGDVDAMRRRVTDELAFSVSSRARLEEQTAELRRSNAELEQFAYVASHDLQEPLRKVASFCQLLQRRYGGELDDRARQYIGFAVDGASRMQVLINDLLAFSRVGRLYDRREAVDLTETVNATVADLAVPIEEAGAQVRVTGELPVLTGDPTLIGMLFQNLIGNAVKFRSPRRAPVIEVSVTDEGERWLFAVQDNGIGIEAQYADKIFVIFQRLHARDAYPGTGIGLAMCKKIVEYYGGRIWLDTDDRPGTRLCFTMPKDTPREGDSSASGPTFQQVTAL